MIMPTILFRLYWKEERAIYLELQFLHTQAVQLRTEDACGILALWFRDTVMF